MSILVAVIITKVETVGLKTEKDQRDSKGEMPDWMIHYICDLKSNSRIISHVIILETNFAINWEIHLIRNMENEDI